jgi:hypothetical protein
MAVTLTHDELTRAKKVAAMLSSPNPGEQANALAILTKLAAAQKTRVDLLLAIVLNGDKTPPSPGPKPDYGPRPAWADYGRASRPQGGHREGGDYDFGDAIKREYERRQKAEKAEAYARAEQAEQERQRKARTTEGNMKARLTALGELPEERLSSWEQSFVQNILMQAGRPFWRPTDKQDAVINRIIEKYIGAA